MHEIYKSLVARAPDAFATPLVRRLRAFAAEHQPGAAEAAGAGRLRLTGELVEAFCRAHPEAAFGVSVFQPPYMRIVYVSPAWDDGWTRPSTEWLADRACSPSVPERAGDRDLAAAAAAASTSPLEERILAATRWSNRDINDTLAMERKVMSETFLNGTTTHGIYIDDGDIRQVVRTPVIWEGAIPDAPDPEYAHLDGNKEDFRASASIVEKGGREGVLYPDGFNSLRLRTASGFRYIHNLVTLVRQCDGRVLHQNTASADFYGLLTERSDLNFLHTYIHRPPPDPDSMRGAPGWPGDSEWGAVEGGEEDDGGEAEGDVISYQRFREEVVDKHGTVTFRHRLDSQTLVQLASVASFTGSEGVGSSLEHLGAPREPHAHVVVPRHNSSSFTPTLDRGDVWLETRVTAGVDPVAANFSARHFAALRERISSQQHLTREEVTPMCIVVQTDITEIKLLEERVLQEHQKVMKQKVANKLTMEKLLFSMMPKPVARELIAGIARPASSRGTASQQPHDEGTDRAGALTDTVSERALDVVESYRTSVGRVRPRRHEHVSICFTDIKGFTAMSQQCDPLEVMCFLDELYNTFDTLLEVVEQLFGNRNLLYKVETIGDAFMIAGGLHVEDYARQSEGGLGESSGSSSDGESPSGQLFRSLTGNDPGALVENGADEVLTSKRERLVHWVETLQPAEPADDAESAGVSERGLARFGSSLLQNVGVVLRSKAKFKELQDRARQRRDTAAAAAEAVLYWAQLAIEAAAELQMPNGEGCAIRAGVHTGDVVSGIVGKKMPRFCLFGDTVNTASRLESNGVANRIHISGPTHALVGELAEWTWESTGGVELKGKGVVPTHLGTCQLQYAEVAAEEEGEE